MVSIGKLGAGQAKYYLDQAIVPMSMASAVSSGVEDYYVGGAEPAGRWCGRSAARLGLIGEVDGEDLHAILAGEDPATGELLRLRGRVPGFDVTFSASKSVSVVFGVADDEIRAAVQRAHDAAVEQGFDYLERHVAFGRRGTDGVERIEGDGLVAAGFVHRTSRAGDPHLHTHVLVANLVHGRDGRWSALDARLLYAHAKTASFLYQAALRAELTRELGVGWEPVRNGIAELSGVDERVRRGFSRRRGEIEAEMRRFGTRSARSAQVAALETRRAKDYRVRPQDLRGEWCERAASVGFGRLALNRALRPRRRERRSVTVEQVFAQLAGPDGLTATRASFTRRDVVRALCERLPVGTRPKEIERAADRFLASDLVVPLLDRPQNRPLITTEGRRFPAGEERSYSTPELLLLEGWIIDRALHTRDTARGQAAETVVERALVPAAFLSGEQQQLVRRLTRAGDGVAVIVGRAGTGKTTALATAHAAWTEAGVPVLGCAVARRAAQELESGSGIPSTSVAALLASIDRPEVRLPDGTVLVVDEAGLLGTRDAARLLGHVDDARGKLVLVGDPHQLPSIAAGGLLAGLATRLEPVELSENRRQHHAWERAALERLRDGPVEPALAAYAAHGRITHARDRSDVFERLVADWQTTRDPDGTVMIAHYRRDVAELNARARGAMRALGALSGEELEASGLRFAVGDRTVVRRNDPRLDVRNGDRGTVAAIDVAAGTLTLRIGDRDRVLPREFLERRTSAGDPSLQHGYAITAYVAQGLTCNNAFVLVHDDADREWAYTALSRGRERNQLYTVTDAARDRHEYAPTAPIRDPDERLGAALGRSRQQQLAIDEAAEVVRRARARDELAQARERRERSRSADRGIGIER